MDAPQTRSSFARRSVRYGLSALVVLLCAFAGWWLAGRKVWTDGGTGPQAIRVHTSHEDPRRVLWTPSRPVLSDDQLRELSRDGDRHVYEPSVSSDGTELFFVLGKAGLPQVDGQIDKLGSGGADLYVSRRKNSRWLAPTAVDGINTRYDELGPRLTADGRFLLFYSNRPGGQGGYDLWAAARGDDERFGPAFNLGPGVNSEFDEYGPAPSADGRRLYFSTNRTAAGREQHTAWRATIRAATTTDFDLWTAELDEALQAAAPTAPPATRSVAGTNPLQPPTTRPVAVAEVPARERAEIVGRGAREVVGLNTPHHEGAPCVSPAGDFIYFASNRPDGHGKFDLYRARIHDGLPAEPENLGPSINSAENETDPQLAQGGFKLLYSSDRVQTSESHADSGRLSSALPAAIVTGAVPASQPAAGLPDAAVAGARVAKSDDRGYDLYEADSREVYPERQGRALPVVGWKLWAMLAGTLLLLPLLFFFVRNINRRNLTLLQRCFLAALCVYALFLFWTTSKHVVMEAYPQLAKDLGFIEVKVNLDPRIEESNVAMAIRQQSSSDLPITAAPTAQLAPQAVPADAITAVPDVAVQVPQAAVGGQAMTVLVAPPKADVPQVAAPALPMVATAVAPAAPAMDVQIAAGQRLQQPEAAPSILAPAPVAVPTPVQPQLQRPAVVPPFDVPAAQPQASGATLARAVDPDLPSARPVEPAKVVVSPAATAVGTSANVVAPMSTGTKVAVAEPLPVSPSTSGGTAERVATASQVTTPSLPSVLGLPMAASSVDAVSLSDRSASSVNSMPVPAPASGTVQVRPITPTTVDGGQLVAAQVPPAALAKVAGIDPQTPRLADALAGTAMQKVAGAPAGDTAQPSLPHQPTPAAGAATGGSPQSLAAAPGIGVSQSPDIARVAGIAPQLPTGELVRNPEVAGPKMTLAPLAGGEARVPVIGPDHAVGLARQDVPTGPLAGGAGPQTAMVPKTPTAGETQTSLAGPAAPGAAAGSITSIAGTSANVRPDSTAVGSPAAIVTNVAKPGSPTTRPVAAEPSLAAAIGLDSPAAASPRMAEAASQVGQDPERGAIGATAALPPSTRPAGEQTTISTPSVASAVVPDTIGSVRIVGPTTEQLAGSAAVAPSVMVDLPRTAIAPVAVATPQPIAGPTTSPSTERLNVGPAVGNVSAPGAVVTATPAHSDLKGPAGGSIAEAAAPRAFASAPAVSTPVIPTPAVGGPATSSAITGISGPQMTLPRVGVASGNASPTADGGQPNGIQIASIKAGGSVPSVERPVVLASANLPGVQPRTNPTGAGPSAAVGPRPGVAVGPSLDIAPNISIATPKLGAPDALFQRSADQRRPMIEKLGGTKESENAVERGLAWLARMQEPDGRWTYVHEGGRKSKSNRQHDMALTGLAVLSFLASDHSPSKDGPYQRVVAGGVDWLVSQQTDDGDLRGPKELRGAGSGKANMYDHGIATMAVAEAALMTGDRRYMDAAFKAAQYICDTQNKKTGGWRYLPGESGDTSVFGWQILALHNAELLGFPTPPEVRERAVKFLSLVSSGKTKILAGYTPGEGATPAMTAEALFCRVLLGQPITGEQAKEVVAYLGREQPTAGNKDLYYWYYMSLSMSQLQANPQVREAWDRWNTRCRDTLVATQLKGGPEVDGSWSDSRWGQQGGRVYSTALATLTLEVYYRYLPLDAADPALPPAGRPEEKSPKGPKKPRFEAN